MLRAGQSALALLALLGAGCSGSADRPDLLLVVVDTLRADHTSLHGYDRHTTPTLEALAAKGAHFERAYAASSWTLPSMAMLLEGRARSHNGGELYAGTDNLFRATALAGYRNAAVVSNPLLGPAEGYGRDHEHYDLYPALPSAGNNGWYARDVAERAEAILAQPDDRPLFLWLHFFDPHAPYTPSGGSLFPPHRDDARRARFAAALPESQRELFDDDAYGGIEDRIALYDTEIRRVDHALERVLKAVATRDEQRNGPGTLVVFTSDHGEGLWTRASMQGEPLREETHFPYLFSDHGLTLHEEQVHVPLVLAGPGVPAGHREGAPVSLLDVVPTVLRLLDLRRPTGLDGVDLLDGEAIAARQQLFGVTSRYTSALEAGRHRLHLPREYLAEQRGMGPELFDLREDPGETAPLDRPELSARLAADAAAWRERYGERPATTTPTDPRRQELLDRLGYTSGQADR